MKTPRLEMLEILGIFQWKLINFVYFCCVFWGENCWKMSYMLLLNILALRTTLSIHPQPAHITRPEYIALHCFVINFLYRHWWGFYVIFRWIIFYILYFIVCVEFSRQQKNDGKNGPQMIKYQFEAFE